jgi:putative radical SAM enzyme (TIGR03279 family)
MPKGMRESLYFKDDDSRLSFLFGNYVTLTNLTDRDIDRIIEMHISPVNVSVHTMNPELRVEMMKNPNSGTSLRYLNRLADAGIKLNTQLVLCPGINDGKELEYSLSELGKLYPAVQSIACVPVGLTKHREGLYPLEAYNEETAAAVIDTVDDFNAHFKFFKGETIAFAADEFYLCAGREIPDADYYGEYPQLENGVGMWRLLEDEFNSALEDSEYELAVSRNIIAVTGAAAYPLIKKLALSAEKKYDKLKINVIKIKNDFFGESVTVAGLLTGQDILSQLEGKDLGDELIIPDCALRDGEEVFLDDMTVTELSEKLGISVTSCVADGYELLDKFLGGE